MCRRGLSSQRIISRHRKPTQNIILFNPRHGAVPSQEKELERTFVDGAFNFSLRFYSVSIRN